MNPFIGNVWEWTDANSCWFGGHTSSCDWEILFNKALLQAYRILSHPSASRLPASLKQLLHSKTAKHFHLLQPGGTFILPILSFLPSHLQVAWIILSYSAHLYLYLACQTVGGKFLSWLILLHISRNRSWLTFMHGRCYMTHGLKKNSCAHINVPAFQIWELTKPNLSHRILCGPKRVNPGML